MDRLRESLREEIRVAADFEGLIRERWKPLLTAAKEVEMYCPDVGDGEQRLRRKIMRKAIAACEEKEGS